MADGTAIEWTDATWNVITGCTVLSPGCTNCYAMKLAGGRLQHHPSRAGLTRPSAKGAVWTGDVRFNVNWLDQPTRWTRPRDIFVCAHADLFHDAVHDAWLHSIFDVMRRCPQHRFQVLTKRPRRAYLYLAGVVPLANVLIGASVEDQHYAYERHDAMESIALLGWRTWVSYEPALGAVDWSGWEFLRWMVSGGESGAHARPSHPDWHRKTRDWCVQRGVPFLFKQHGEWLATTFCTDEQAALPYRRIAYVANSGLVKDGTDGVDFFGGDEEVTLVGKKAAGRMLDRVEHNGMPA